MHFDNVTTLIFQLGRHLIQALFGILAQHGLSGTVLNHSLRPSLVLIEAVHDSFDVRKPSVNSARGLLR